MKFGSRMLKASCKTTQRRIKSFSVPFECLATRGPSDLDAAPWVVRSYGRSLARANACLPVLRWPLGLSTCSKASHLLLRAFRNVYSFPTFSLSALRLSPAVKTCYNVGHSQDECLFVIHSLQSYPRTACHDSGTIVEEFEAPSD